MQTKVGNCDPPYSSWLQSTQVWQEKNTRTDVTTSQEQSTGTYLGNTRYSVMQKIGGIINQRKRWKMKRSRSYGTLMFILIGRLKQGSRTL